MGHKIQDAYKNGDRKKEEMNIKENKSL